MDDPDLDNAVKIMAGLLASGHYTELKDYEDTDGEEPKVKMWDAGKGEEPRFHYHVVDDAISILFKLKDKLKTR